MTRARLAATVLGAALFGAGAPAPAQERGAPAVVYGTILDTAGAPLARVRLRVSTGGAAFTDAAGRYVLADLPAGTLVVSAEMIGFTPATRTLSVAAGDSLRADFTLTPATLGAAVELAGVVVTAAKHSQLVEEAVTTVMVISERDIAARVVNTVDESLDRAAGVQFINGQINIRGSTGYAQGLGARVLLLVDGIPVNQGDRGGINWDIVPVDQVARVEIVKGAGSALYGSAAFGGVVNLITRSIPDGPHARLRASAGAFSHPPYPEWQFRDERGLQGGLSLAASYGAGPIRGGLAAAVRRSDGYREQDAREHRQLAGQSQWDVSDDTRLRVSGAWAVDDYAVPLAWCTRGFCDDRGQAYQPFKIDETERGARTSSRKGYLAGTLAHRASDRVYWDARASWVRTRFNDRRPSATDYSIANRLGAEARGAFRTTDGGIATIGGEATHALVSSDVFGVHTQSEYAAYGQSEQLMGDVRVTAGLRVDYLAVDGGGLRAVVSPRVGAVLPLARGAWRASAGHGFRAPSIAERFAQTAALGFEVIPNPGLDPETSWGFELGYASTLAREARVDAALFWTEAEGLIEPALALESGVPRIQFRNVARARLMGLDLVATATAPFAPALSVSLAYQFLHARELARDGVPERPLAFRPAHLLTANMEYGVSAALMLGVEYRHASRFARVELYPDDPRVAAGALGLRVLYRHQSLTATLQVSNALNRIYTLVPRTLAPVRTLTATATWTY